MFGDIEMNIVKTKIDGLLIIEPRKFKDNRGWFMESYSKSILQNSNISLDFLQDNHSLSVEKGTIRGLHYQSYPKQQTKLVRCLRGSIFDVAVDIRTESSTFGKWFGIELSAENQKQLLIPKGFAHGFLTLSNNAEVFYKVDEFYSPQHDKGIIWNDPEIGIEWPIDNSPILSIKDKALPPLKEAIAQYEE